MVLHLLALEFTTKNKAGDSQLATRLSQKLRKPCVKIDRSLWISAFRFPRFLEPPFIRFWWTSCNIGRCVQDGSNECGQKTTNGNKWTLPVNFSAAMQTKSITFWFRLSQATKCQHITSHLRRNNNHVSGCIPFRLSCENSSKQSVVKVMATVFWDRKGV